MERLGAVSLWLGNCKNENFLRQYVDIKFDETGERIPSTFMNDFKIDFTEYNQDLVECTFIHPPTSSLSKLLRNASYSDTIIDELVDLYGPHLSEQYNVAIRLYDFEYPETVEHLMVKN